jgi:prepilin-type N-terminal cleavage/methylation domain-containing protein
MKRSNAKAGFTIVEILTVMSIIVILITLLVPSLNMAKRYARGVRQRAQFHSIDVALDLFSATWEGYPPSNAKDEATPPVSYCGAMKLCEALMGKDLLGFHPSSRFRSDGLDSTGGTQLYPQAPAPITPVYLENLKSRKGPYLQLENANAFKVKHLYGEGQKVAPFKGNEFVLCDVYNRVVLKPASDDAVGEKIKGKSGMPILYYKADTSKNKHSLTQLPPTETDDIYNFLDNDELVKLALPWNTTVYHPMALGGLATSTGGVSDPLIFYQKTQDTKITTTVRPYRADSYILISAGFDGEYGTPDDVFNFGE